MGGRCRCPGQTQLLEQIRVRKKGNPRIWIAHSLRVESLNRYNNSLGSCARFVDEVGPKIRPKGIIDRQQTENGHDQWPHHSSRMEEKDSCY